MNEKYGKTGYTPETKYDFYDDYDYKVPEDEFSLDSEDSFFDGHSFFPSWNVGNGSTVIKLDDDIFGDLD